VVTNVGSICSFLNGGTPSRAVARFFSGDIPWITGADIAGPVIETARSFITSEAVQSSATNLVPFGTVLLVTRTSVGKVAVAGKELCFSQDITALKPDTDRVETAYLVHYLRSKQAYFEQAARGATIRGVTREVVSKLSILLPPLPEQRRIAEVMDRAEALRAMRRDALAQLDTLTQSIFLDMFGDHSTILKQWPTKKLGELLDFLTSGSRGWAEYYADSAICFSEFRTCAAMSCCLPTSHM
jgi:type I restriction enzyme S subunit